MGDNSLYSIISSVLVVYNINAPVDETGTPKQLEANYRSGLLSYVFLLWSPFIALPVPFNCKIEPRSKAAEFLIRGLSD